ncbi:FAD-dependent oxidoreductase [Ammoniphilus resinae]|uniref:Glucose-inhibited division protein A n=1 Tax=Ammoniphilus resinae TaxID=861532 RepID=A0ABS4GJA0_9BACL|nr:FAD-dependent oxidoreductase [Ammoniphilus resinae]MBP1930348.1 hypothetical protein [Ammoniphilus resinae]
MLKKWYIWLFGAVLLIPVILYGTWKTYEWILLERLRSIDIQVAPYSKEITSQNYDVIVVGGEPEGVAAAVSAARNGAKTLLVEHREGLGGLLTFGMLNFLDIDHEMRGEVANAGIFKEWHRMVGGRVTFDIETAKKAFLKLVQNEPNLSLLLGTELTKPILEGKRIIGVEVQGESGKQTYYANRFIDSTQNADLAALAGVPYFIGNQDIGVSQKMSTTLMIHLKGVDWDKVLATAYTHKFGPAKANVTAAWGFGGLLTAYKPSQPDVRLRGFNMVRSSDNMIYINALQIFGIDGLDSDSLEKAKEKGRKETEHIVQFLRKEFPGFENAQIASFPTELYVRETRHVLAEYQLPISDVWENRDHPDRIGFGSYPVDIQATSTQNTGYVLTDPIQYAIPFRSLVPLEIDQLLVASKAAGYSSLAAGSARVVPTGMTVAEAAGVAAVLSIRNNVDFREMTKSKEMISNLQEILTKQGALLYAYELEYPYQGEWFYPDIRELLTYGLISGGYKNEFPVDSPMKEMALVNLLMNGIERKNADLYVKLKERLTQVRYLVTEGQEIKRDQAARFIEYMVSGTKSKDPWAWVTKRNLVEPHLTSSLVENRVLTTAECYSLVAGIMQKLDVIEKMEGRSK